MPNHKYLVEMTGINKRFGGVIALDSVDFKLKKGEIHALVGENGAGKSTLMKILAGALPMDSGEIFIEGTKVLITNPKSGIDHGISVIYQEFALVNHLSVAENIFIENLCGEGKYVNWKKLQSKARAALDDLGFPDISEKSVVKDLSIANQQIVEICKAISKNVRVLVLDEPTSLLTTRDVEQLFKLLNDLKARGVSIVYISHRLKEIFEISDRVTVLKDGKNVGTVDTSSINESNLTNMMVGRDMKDYFPKRASNIGETVLQVKGVRRGREVKDVSFEVNEGEVLGITGLVGSGRSEALKAIFGADKLEAGDIYLNGEEIKIKSPEHAVKLGIGLLPEDRKAEGVILRLPIRYNITLSCLGKFCGLFGWINSKAETEMLNDIVDKLAIKAPSLDEKVSNLSGGNQQKVAIGKLLASGSRIMFLDEPTRGVDVGAKVEIYKIINSLVDQKIAVVMVSSEMNEVIGMCDRVVVMREGEVVGQLSKDELTEQNIIKLSMGVEN